MRDIKLKSDKPFHNNCDVAVIDVTEGTEKKRCKITVEYAQYDIEQLKKEGHSYETAQEYYRDWIYRTVKRYLGDDWNCTEGFAEIMEIIDTYTKPYFAKEDTNSHGTA